MINFYANYENIGERRILSERKNPVLDNVSLVMPEIVEKLHEIIFYDKTCNTLINFRRSIYEIDITTFRVGSQYKISANIITAICNY